MQYRSVKRKIKEDGDGPFSFSRGEGLLKSFGSTLLGAGSRLFDSALDDPALSAIRSALSAKLLSSSDLLKVKGAGWFKKLFKKIAKFFQKVINAVVKVLQKIISAVTKTVTATFGKSVGRFIGSILQAPVNFLMNTAHYLGQGDFKGLLKYWGQVFVRVALMVFVAIVAPYILGALFAFLGSVLGFIGGFLSAIGGFLGNTLPLLGQVIGGALRVAGSVLNFAGQLLSRAGDKLLTQVAAALGKSTVVAFEFPHFWS